MRLFIPGFIIGMVLTGWVAETIYKQNIVLKVEKCYAGNNKACHDVDLNSWNENIK